MITKGNFGGAQRYLFDLAINLPKDRFEVVVGCGQGQSLKQKLEDKKIRVFEMESSLRNVNFFKDIKLFFEIKKIIESERPDVVHLNSSKIGFLGSLACFLLKSNEFQIKSIFTAHGWAFNEERNIFERYIFKIFHWITVLAADHTIAVCQKIKSDMGGMPFIKSKITVIHNGIANFKLESKKHSREVLGIMDSHRKIIIALAELHKNKGIDIAVRGIAELPEDARERVELLVAGEGEERENLQKLISELNLQNSVKLLGFVPEAKKYLCGADAFLLSSRTEAFPYVILEAGLAGLPIISTSVGGISEVVKDMQNGILVHPKNPKEIAEAILYLLDHPQKQKEFSCEIKTTVSNFFTLSKMLSETINLYIS